MTSPADSSPRSIMRLAIIGTGISGLVTARELHARHDITLFEAQSHIGGHTLTTDVEWNGTRYAVDAGFIVYNETNYPNLTRLFDRLGVATQRTSMSFSVLDAGSGLEYAGTSFGSLFAQRRNLLSPPFWRMLYDVSRFNRDSRELLTSGDTERSLGEVLATGGYSRQFVERYLIPMGAAIWSMPPKRMLDFPAGLFLRFLDNHGLLSVDGHLTWRSVVGGSKRYVEHLVRPFRDRIRLRTPVTSIRRGRSAVSVSTAGGEVIDFDQVILATHSDQALRLLADPSDSEREILGAISYQPNEAVLHTDTSILPSRRRAWASWNYRVPAGSSDRVAVTYNMKMLQRLPAEAPTFCVSLNLTHRLDPKRVLRRFVFDHPVFGPDSVRAQARWNEISGVDRTHFCGAYWANGFHEDGLVSGLRVARALSDRPERGTPLPMLARRGDPVSGQAAREIAG